MNNLITNKPSMSSLEIAEMVGSRHDSVKRTIERLADSEIIQLPPMVKVENKQSNSPNRFVEVYNFEGDSGKRDSIIVVAQLYPEFTARLVDRWRELEEERARHKSQAEIIAEMAMYNLEQERRLNQVEEKIETVSETVEKIKRGSIPEGWIGFSGLKARLGITPLKSRRLVDEYNVPTDSHDFLTPDGVLAKRDIVHYESFMRALHQIKPDTEKRGTRWWHPKMGIFQLLKWED
ncbi:Rha family transcriptional regulator [Salmonella enterica subsp. enterica serovar Benin]|nr:Rha family transcriptional regulator [Salmonella enterica subsp. enterica]EIZ5130076.1 Rha family transcriptional regulator [Salmonella enterica]ELD8107767.1 Rha family transcriptional regulator [Salmonella enterica subsp. enterica serovar Benin]ELD9381970.1 Rha family transcriptional regulator [Salmonella enterica subsp. enterica serovar Benin]ELQ8809666.1 Rha family transcriptional regulator [Salmonella enterica]